jgi:tetratricopeptide (TPR) repeat protein
MKNATEQELTSLTARSRYYTYAQEQLALAAGSERAGSMALYGLARVQMALAERNSERHVTSAPQAMTLHQAALLVDEENYMAANELGVMLARFGQYEHARSLLTRSLSVAPQSTTWNNLAAVHRHLGETELAEKATQQAAALTRAERLAQTTRSTTSKEVVWTDPKNFTGKSVATGSEAAGRR